MSGEYNSAAIAALAGVSRSTVSRVVNNSGSVHPKTREKVMQAIERYGYSPSFPARVLAGGKTGNLGLFMREDSEIVEEYVLESQIVATMRTANRYGYLVVPCMVSDYTSPENKQTIRNFFTQSRIDTAVLYGTQIREPIIFELAGEGFRFGVTDQLRGEIPEEIAVANLDYYTCGQQQVEYLYGLGHRHIALIHGDLRRNSGVHKREGNLKAMMKHGLSLPDEWDLNGSFTEKNGYESACRILQGNPRPTAICCANDSIAYGVYRACAEYKLEIPGDVSVIAMDNLQFSQYMSPALTTFEVGFRETTRRITRQVIQSIGAKSGARKNQEITCDIQLVERASCAGPGK